MSDSFGRILPPAPTSGGAARGGQIVQITLLPETLTNSAKAVRLEGRVAQLNNDGTVRIETSRGNIGVKIKGGKQPQKGQRIEIELPAGNPPKQAVIKRAPPQNINQANTKPQSTVPGPPTLPTTVITDPRITTPVPPQITQTNTTKPSHTTNQQTQIITNSAQRTTQPLPPALQEAVSQANATNNTATQSRPLTVEAVVRLLSVPPAQAQTIATEYIQALPQPQLNTLTRVAFTANLTAQNAQDQLTQSFFQIPKTGTTIPPQQLTSNIKNFYQPVVSNNFLQTPATPPISLTPPSNTPLTTGFLTPQPNTQVIPAGQILPVTQVAEILQIPQQTQNISNTLNTPQTPQPATLTPIPINFDPTNPNNLISSRFQKIDIQIVQITPPAPNITPITSTVSQTPPLPATTQFAPPTPTIAAPTNNITQAITTPSSNTTQTHLLPIATQLASPLTSVNNAVTTTAQVTGFTQAGLPLVTTQWPGSTLPQSFVLQFNSNNLQLGSQLQIIPKTSVIPVVPITTPQISIMNTLLQGFQWPALNELYNSLLQINPQAAASLTRSLPNAGNPTQIGTAAMMFIAAIKSGNLGSFLGDKKIDLIQRAGRGDILSKLTQSATNTSRTAAPEPASSSDWRAVPLPMFWEGEIHKITLYTRHENHENKQDNDKRGQTRFVFDLSLSRMGDIQLDGLLRDNRLDLVIRTQNGFSEPMQQTMRQAYSTALSHTDLSGDLNFQGNTKNWVHVLEQKEQLGVNV